MQNNKFGLLLAQLVWRTPLNICTSNLDLAYLRKSKSMDSLLQVGVNPHLHLLNQTDERHVISYPVHNAVDHPLDYLDLYTFLPS